MLSQTWRSLLAMAFSVALLAGAAEAETKTVVVGTVGHDFPPAQIAQSILTEAYAQIGYRARFVPYPPLRMIKELDQGRIDALILAEARFGDEHPASLQVKVPIWSDELVAFSKQPMGIRSWEDLKPLRVGFLKGMLIIETKLANAERREAVSGPEALFLMLDAGRTDVVVTSKLIGQLSVRKLGLQGIAPASPVLETLPLFHFLARKNAELAAPLEAALVEMRRSGRMAELKRAKVTKLLPGP